MPKDGKGAANNLPAGGDELAAHLATLGDAELSELREQLLTEFDSIFGDDGANVDVDGFERLDKLKTQILAINDVTTARDTEQSERAKAAAALKAEINATDKPDTEDAAADADGDDGDDADDDTAAEVPAGELVAASALDSKALGAVVSAAVGETVKAFAADYLKPATDLNQRTRFGIAAQYAPDAKVPVEREEAVIVASADVPGFTQGGRIDGLEDLARAMHARARALPVSRSGKPSPSLVASLQREHTFTLDDKATPSQMNAVLQAAADPEILTAAGGWCAPSEISYDFFNIVCIDGMVDLPTIGVNRGGIQHPISPSFGDLAGLDDIVWTWTEQDDIEAEDSDSIFKPCVRVQCPEFVERRLDCDGFCVTAGNLVDYAYPELIANWLRLVFAIRAKATNARIIDLMLNGGGSGTDFGPSLQVDHTGLLGATTASLLNSVALSAVDYRAKFSMCRDAILEVVLPQMANEVLRADLANRDGIDVFAVSDGMIADWFNLRNVRIQYVGDWQVRGTDEPGQATPITDWPGTLDYMIYAPGTFVRGNGMSLDLGVVRDSVLNAKNDHTAAWAEDCYLLAKPGHESRVVTTAICGSGEIGARTFTCAAD